MFSSYLLVVREIRLNTIIISLLHPALNLQQYGSNQTKTPREFFRFNLPNLMYHYIYHFISLPLVPRVGQFPPDRYEVTDVLIEGVLFPSLGDCQFRVFAYILGQHDRFAQFSGGVVRAGCSQYAQACRILPISIVTSFRRRAWECYY